MADAAIVFFKWFLSFSSLMLKQDWKKENPRRHCVLNKTILSNDDFDWSFTGTLPPCTLEAMAVWL